ASWQRNAGNGYGHVSADRNLSEQSARDGNLCDIADAKSREPRFGLWKALDQIRAAERGGDYWLASLEELFGERNLLCGNVYVALAIADAHEKRKNRDIVRFRRRKFQHTGVHEACVGAQRGHQIKSRLQLPLEVFARIRLGIGIKSEQQRSAGLGAVQRKA